MKQILKHMLDNLFVGLLYLGMIVFPLFIVLNILNVCDFESGLVNLIAIFFSVVFTIACRLAAREARHCHSHGRLFLFN